MTIEYMTRDQAWILLDLYKTASAENPKLYAILEPIMLKLESDLNWNPSDSSYPDT